MRDVIENKLKVKMAKKVKERDRGRKMPEMYFLIQLGTLYLKHLVEETS